MSGLYYRLVRRVCNVHGGFLLGDYGLAIQGALPSLVNTVNKTATGYGKTCDKFFMFTPSGEMLCRNSNGDIVATSAEDRFFPESEVSFGKKECVCVSPTVLINISQTCYLKQNS